MSALSLREIIVTKRNRIQCCVRCMMLWAEALFSRMVSLNILWAVDQKCRLGFCIDATCEKSCEFVNDIEKIKSHEKSEHWTVFFGAIYDFNQQENTQLICISKPFITFMHLVCIFHVHQAWQIKRIRYLTNFNLVDFIS